MAVGGYGCHQQMRDLNMERTTEGHCLGGAPQKMEEDGIRHGKQHTALILVLALNFMFLKLLLKVQRETG